jgi:hypothetical protein
MTAVGIAARVTETVIPAGSRYPVPWIATLKISTDIQILL